MKLDDADAIADFLNRGGEILKFQGAIPVTEQELLVYLASCGLMVKCFPGDLKPYGCQRTRYTALGLLRLANTYRRDQNLSPLML